MSRSVFAEGSIIDVQQYHYPLEPALKVEIISSVSVGSGATARIYKGLADPPGYTYEVALKVIPDLLDEEKQKVLEKLIFREVDALSRLSKRQMRRILPFIGVASMQFHMIIVSKFMRNGNLLHYFRVTPEADRQRLVIQVAEGVYWLHESANLVHGDLKCENVLVSDKGDAVIADFGLATLVEQESSNLTTITAIRGMSTLPFAAPELLDPPERAKMDERPRSKTRETDVYAFGMLTLQVEGSDPHVCTGLLISSSGFLFFFFFFFFFCGSIRCREQSHSDPSLYPALPAPLAGWALKRWDNQDHQSHQI